MSDIDKVVNRIQNMVARATIETVDDSQEMQLVKISVKDGEGAQDGIEHVQNYGLSSRAPKGAQAVVIYLQGVEDDGLVIATEHASARPTDLNDGEVIIWSDHGKSIILRDDSKISIAGDTDNAVRFSKFKEVVDDLQAKWDAFANAYAPGGPTVVGTPPTALPSTKTTDPAKVEEVLLP